MTLLLEAEKVPISINADGAARIGKTRVNLETVIAAFHRGDSPEQIVDSFDVLSLAEVYSVIGYYLNHREEVDAYIAQRDHEAEKLRREIEAKQPDTFSLRARLLARKRQS